MLSSTKISKLFCIMGVRLFQPGYISKCLCFDTMIECF